MCCYFLRHGLHLSQQRRPTRMSKQASPARLCRSCTSLRSRIGISHWLQLLPMLCSKRLDCSCSLHMAMLNWIFPRLYMSLLCTKLRSRGLTSSMHDKLWSKYYHAGVHHTKATCKTWKWAFWEASAWHILEAWQNAFRLGASAIQWCFFKSLAKSPLPSPSI